jgi:hypothetical protein
MQMDKHIQVLGILHIVYSSIALLSGAIVFLLFFGTGVFVSRLDDVQTANVPAILFTVGSAIALILVIVSIPGIIGGIGLLKRKEWARILVLVVGFLDLLHIPLGTLLGIYTIWALMNDEAIKLFTRQTGTVVRT